MGERKEKKKEKKNEEENGKRNRVYVKIKTIDEAKGRNETGNSQLGNREEKERKKERELFSCCIVLLRDVLRHCKVRRLQMRKRFQLSIRKAKSVIQTSSCVFLNAGQLVDSPRHLFFIVDFDLHFYLFFFFFCKLKLCLVFVCQVLIRLHQIFILFLLLSFFFIFANANSHFRIGLSLRDWSGVIAFIWKKDTKKGGGKK